jgi:hypothetical protein
MLHMGRRGGSARAGVVGAILVSIALFGMMLTPALASAEEEVAPAVKAALAPVNTAAPTLTGTPALGQTLTCSTGTWANNPTSFSYVWLRSGVAIAGQTGSTYVVQAADEGHTISCQVTAGNGGGSYTITGLATGSYKIHFRSEEGVNYLSQYYNGKPAETEATPVAVTAPATTEGVNAELHAGGQISGRVIAAATHAPLANVDICAENQSTKNYYCALTSSSGEYAITGMPSGSYRVEFFSFLSEVSYLSQYYSNKSSIGEAETIGVTAGTTVAGINAELQSANQGGQITGTVTEASGAAAPIAGIEVCAYDTSEVDFFETCAPTNSKGEYALSGLPEGTFEVFFSGENCESEPCTTQNYLPQYYQGQTSRGAATFLKVVANKSTNGINAKMEAGGEVEGRVVSAAAGEPALAYVVVCADGSESEICTESNGNGEYKIKGLPTGSSYEFLFNDYSGNYVDATVEHVSIKAGEVTEGVDAKLSVGGQISGRVTDASTHAGVEKTQVCADGSGGEGSRCAATNSSGEYTISSLATGSYIVIVSFNPGSETPYLSQSRSGVSVTAGSTTPNINAELQTGAQISGLVTDATTHAGIAKIVVCAEMTDGGKCATTETGAASASATSNSATVPSGNFTQAKAPKFDPKTGDIDFSFTFPTAGTLKWSLFFKNADVSFADSLGISLGADEPGLAEAARRKGKAKPKECKRTELRHHGRCVATLVSFASGSQSVAAGTVEVKVHAGSRALRALKSGHTLHVSGSFTFQSALGGLPVAHTVSTVVHPIKKAAKGKKHGKGKRR